MAELKTQFAKHLGMNLWYLPSVFDQRTFTAMKREYREKESPWELTYPNRIKSSFDKHNYGLIQQVAEEICPAISQLAGIKLIPVAQEVFIDLPGHKLSWHFDANNYKILLQVYMGDTLMPNAGTQWYIGDKNQELWDQYGSDSIVDVNGLPTVETLYAPNAGYINDNTIKKAHGTNKVLPGAVRESLLFTYR